MNIRGSMVAAMGLAAVALGACGSSEESVSRLSASEERLGVATNFWGADGRKFHHVLHYSNAVGPRFPGYIVGLEKSSQNTIGGPKMYPDLLAPVPSGQKMTSARANLTSDLKVHFLSHVVNYWAAPAEYSVLAYRMRTCVNYSAIEHGELDRYKTVAEKDRSPLRLFDECHPKREQHITNVQEAFDRSWQGLKFFKTDLKSDLDSRLGEKQPYSHIFVIVMGWNTPQAEAVQNYNSIVGHFLDMVDSKRRDYADQWFANACTSEYPETCKRLEAECAVGAPKESREACEKERAGLKTARFDRECAGAKAPPECKFRPMLIGVTWASNWEISPMIPLPAAVVRLISFPNKAADAEEVGITWLNALIHNVVLPVRDEYEREHQTKPKVTLVGHSFGARALMATLSQPPALKDKGLPAIREFADGDSFISLEGAFETDKLFEDQNVANGLNKELDSKKLRTILVASQFDEAVKVAFWDTYAGSVDGFDKLCVDQRASTKKIIDCEVVQANMESRYGFNQCRATKVRPAQIDRSEEARVLYLDASAVINCNAAFTGGGSHSDIYRLEMAHMLWDYLNIKPKLGDKLAQN